MSYLNVEIKASCADPAFIRNYLLSKQADFRGVDEQTDTYFRVSRGRLKLREGVIENNLIYYEREDRPGPKDSHFHLVRVDDAAGLKGMLERANGIKVIVKKKREIYFIKNVKFHIDKVQGLGSFVEIEAGNRLADLSKEQLNAQCVFYLKEFQIKQEDLVEKSYSDLMPGGFI
jgi:adenylate cyclase class 2